MSTMYRSVTHDIAVSVLPEYLPERSDVDRGHWFWAYTIEIANEGETAVQVTHRHWRITDANGHMEEVRGPGIVGEQPLLKPGETFRYTSGCPLGTSSGFMVGSYRILEEGGKVFEVDIPMFSLDPPAEKRVLN